MDNSKGQKNLFNCVLFSSTGYIDKTEVVKAELLFAGFFIGHNLPLATADHVGIFLQSILWSWTMNWKKKHGSMEDGKYIPAPVQNIGLDSRLTETPPPDM